MKTFHRIFLLAVVLITTAGGNQAPVQRKNVCKAVKKCQKLLNSGLECPILPVSNSSLLTPLGPQGFALTKLRDEVWLYEDGGYQSLFLKQGRRLAVLDLPDSPGSRKPDGSKTRLTDAAERVLDGVSPKRIDIVYSHAHFDHIGASPLFYRYMQGKYPRAKLAVWGTKEVDKLVKNSVTKRAVLPNVIVGNKRRVLRLGRGLRVEMTMVAGHTENDLMLYIPGSKDQKSIAMLVDSAYPGWAPPLELGFTYNVGSHIAAQKELLKKDFDIFVGGHTKAGTRVDVERNLRYSEDLVQTALMSVSAVSQKELAEAGFGKFVQPGAVEFGNIYYAIVGLRLKLNVDVCYKTMLPKWGCALGGLDFVLRSHCQTAIAYLVTDY